MTAAIDASARISAFPGFSFSTAPVDDFCWRGDTRTVLSADGTRLGNHYDWVERELGELGGDLAAFWSRHRASGFRCAEWRGTAVYAIAPTGPGVADFIQLGFEREHEFLASPVVDLDYRPHSAFSLFDPSGEHEDLWGRSRCGCVATTNWKRKEAGAKANYATRIANCLTRDGFGLKAYLACRLRII